RRVAVRTISGRVGGGRRASALLPTSQRGRIAMAARTPEECDVLFERHLNAGDLDALADLYEPGATLLMAPGELQVGNAAIREALGGLIAQKARLTLTVAQVLRAGDDLAVLYGNWSGHYT